MTVPCRLNYRIKRTILHVKFSTGDILKVINNLDSNKAHGEDKIGIRMLKLCAWSVCRPLQIIYKSCLDRRKFPQEWKKAKVVSVHKKYDKQLLKDYCPIYLLPICGKILERIAYNSVFELSSVSSSVWFQVRWLLYESIVFNNSWDISLHRWSYEVRGAFLDILKAFDKVLFLKINAEWDNWQITQYFRRFSKI